MDYNESVCLNVTSGSCNRSFREPCVADLGRGNQVIIAAFALIFCLSVTGNGLVIVTIVQQRWMRTVTNLYLLNLAISDLLLVSICMPPTLLALLLRCFLFGTVFCKIVSFLQPVSVTASAYTLTIIALERYFAICRPLHSRHWQTKSHAVKMILLTWLLSFAVNFVAFFVHENRRLPNGSHNCYMSLVGVQGLAYMICLTFALCLVPLCAMLLLYGLVIRSLWMGIQIEKQSSGMPNGENEESGRKRSGLGWRKREKKSGGGGQQMVLRSNQMEKNLLAKKRVIRMLLTVVLVFFVCWTPLYANGIAYFVTDRIQLPRYKTFLTLAYLSTCTNPICYCFFNRKFRQAFLLAFGCHRFVDRRLDTTTVRGTTRDSRPPPLLRPPSRHTPSSHLPSTPRFRGHLETPL